MTVSHGYAPDPRAAWKRWLQQHLFPQSHLEPGGEDGNPVFAPGEAITGCHVTLDWKDRLRVLVSGRFNVEMRLRTDAPIGLIQSRTQFNVTPPRLLQ
jgi:hypothetical protein